MVVVNPQKAENRSWKYMNVGSVELTVLALCAVLLLIIIAGSSRLNVPRHLGQKGIACHKSL